VDAVADLHRERVEEAEEAAEDDDGGARAG